MFHRAIHGLCESIPEHLQFILAVEQVPCTLRQIVKSLSKAMGRSKTKEITSEEAFLYTDMNVRYIQAVSPQHICSVIPLLFLMFLYNLPCTSYSCRKCSGEFKNYYYM